MTLEVMPFGVRCNIACTYCYQQPMRDAQREAPYDLSAIKATLEKRDEPFIVFGGEPLLMPVADLEELFALGVARYETFSDSVKRAHGSPNGVQTNASLIVDAHLELFRRYGVHVGVSIDGPDELNDARRVGSLEQTRRTTSRSQENLERLLAEGIPCSLIVTLHRINASVERLPRLQAWLSSLAARGLRTARAHLLEVDGRDAERLALTEDEAVAAMLALREVPSLKLVEFEDLLALLRGRDEHVTCVWNGCDPWTTPAVQAVDRQGTMRNCGRTNKDGTNWLKGQKGSQVRQLALYNTPYADGGCSGCRFFIACKGSCPGHAIDGDWRNRPRDCGVWLKLFAAVERDLLRVGETPVSLRQDLPELEKRMLAGWTEGRPVRIFEALQAPQAPQAHGDAHGDHTDVGPTLRATGRGELV